MKCVYCGSNHVQRDGKHNGFQRYKCMECHKRFDGEEYQSMFLYHFNVKIKKTDRNRLTRDNYCIPTNELDYKEKKNIRIAKEVHARKQGEPTLIPEFYYNIPNQTFADEEHYTDEWVEEHYQACMENYDLNMTFFERLNYDTFDKYLQRFVKKNKFVKTDDLNVLEGKCGIYIMVLDKYKQVYIGKSESAGGMKQRIMTHWSKRKEFGRLLNGRVETSILSIDSFGALDTTRIFYKELRGYQDIDEYEEKLVAEFKSDYRLNRVAGGLNAEGEQAARNLMLMGTVQERKLK